MGVISVLWSPAQTLEAVAERRDVLAGFLVVAANAALGLIGSTALFLSGAYETQIEDQLRAPDTGLPPGFAEDMSRVAEVFAPATIVFSVLSPFVYWLVVSLVMQLVTRFFDGEGPLAAMFAVVGVSQLVFVLSSLVSFPLTLLQSALGSGSGAAQIVGLLGSLLSIAFLLWYVVLVVIGAAKARNISYGESTGSCAISCAGCLGLVIATVVAIVVLVAVLAGAAGGGSL